MTFLNIAILSALVLGALPVLIHLLNRQRFQRVRFPTLRFLRELQKRRMRRIKLRQIILLILRTLAIIFAVIALARPVLRSAGFPGLAARSGTASVVLLDVSGSMEAVSAEGSVFRQALSAADRLTDLMGEGDRGYLIALAQPHEMVIPDGSESRTYFEERVQGLAPMPLSSDVTNGLIATQGPLEASPEANHEIYIVSDFRTNCWDGKPGLGELIPLEAKVFLMPVGREHIPNRAVVSTKVLSRLLEPNRPVEVEVTLSNFAEEPAEDLFLSLYFEDRRVAQSSLSLGPGETRAVPFSIIPEHAGYLSGYAVLEDDDALMTDNRSYFTLTIPERIRVALVGSDPAVLQYLTLALVPEGGGVGIVEAQEIPLTRWETADLSVVDVLILADVPGISSGASQKVQHFTARGGGLLIIPGPHLEVRNYNNGLLKALGLPSLGTKIGSEGTGDAALIWDRIDWTHPLFAGIFRDEARPDPPKVYQTYQVFGGQNSVAVITLSNGVPTLTEVAVDRGRAFLLTTYPDFRWSDLPRHGLFAPLVHRVANYLATARPGEEKAIAAGDPLVFVTDKASITEQVVLSKPSGATVQIIPKALPQVVELTYPAVKETGVFSMVGKDGVLQTFAVNMDPEESDLSRTDLEELRQALGADRTQILDMEHLEDQILAARYGQELWQFFLIGALGFLIAEMLVGRQGKETS